MASDLDELTAPVSGRLVVPHSLSTPEYEPSVASFLLTAAAHEASAAAWGVDASGTAADDRP